jgi:hypothetical protein
LLISNTIFKIISLLKSNDAPNEELVKSLILTGFENLSGLNFTSPKAKTKRDYLLR